tara:strand:+ start:2654 stop:3505 length:852 start_codon:yes stop_codon:yes gene_type:complete
LKEIHLVSFVFLILIFSGTSLAFSENMSINIDNSFYKKSDIISVWGLAPDVSQNLVFITIKNPSGEIVWTEKILVDEEGNFSTLVIAGMNGWLTSGTYEILLESGEVIDIATFFYDSGSQVNPPSVVEGFYISQEDLIITFAICIIVVVGIFVYLARNIILRKKTKYDQLDLDSKKNRDYEKYHSEWTEEEIFGSRKESTINQKTFNEMLKNKTLPNYYDVLGVEQSASPEQIKEQFRLLAKEWHPDRRKDSSEEKMAEINQAYEVLSNQKLREEYDKYYKLL